MSKAQNRHDTAKWKKRRINHLAAQCGKPKCSICHPHKAVGGNSLQVVKAKYRVYSKKEIEANRSSAYDYLFN